MIYRASISVPNLLSLAQSAEDNGTEVVIKAHIDSQGAYMTIETDYPDRAGRLVLVGDQPERIDQGDS